MIVLLSILERCPTNPSELATRPTSDEKGETEDVVVKTIAFPEREQALAYVVEQIRVSGTRNRFYAVQEAEELSQTLIVQGTEARPPEGLGDLFG